MKSRFLANEAEAVMRRVIMYELLRNPMALVIFLPSFSRRRRCINNGEQSAGLQRAKHRSQHRIMLSHLVIRVHDQHGIEFFYRKLGVVFRSQNPLNLHELLALCPIVNLFHFLFQNVLRVHFPAWSHALCKMECEVSTARSDIPYHAPWFDPQGVHYSIRLLPGVSRFGVILSR